MKLKRTVPLWVVLLVSVAVGSMLRLVVEAVWGWPS